MLFSRFWQRPVEARYGLPLQITFADKKPDTDNAVLADGHGLPFGPLAYVGKHRLTVSVFFRMVRVIRVRFCRGMSFGSRYFSMPSSSTSKMRVE